MTPKQIAKWLKALPDTTARDPEWPLEQCEAFRAKRTADEHAFKAMVYDLIRFNPELADLAEVLGRDNLREGFPDVTERSIGFWATLQRCVASAAGCVFEDAGININRALGRTIY
jgi:hypothetical protein